MPKKFFRSVTKRVFIIANIIVAVLFLLGCYVKWFDVSKYWPLGFLTLGSFYLLALLLLFFLFWLLFRSRWAFLFIVVIALTWKHIQNIVPFRLPSSFSIQKSPQVLRVMSWNVLEFEILDYPNHPEKKEAMMKLINDYHPDVACFQEMVTGDSSNNNVIYTLEGFIDTLNFPYQFYSYNAKEDFYPANHYGIIIFSRYPIVKKQTVSFAPHDYNSIFQYADILKGDDTIRVINLHLQSL